MNRIEKIEVQHWGAIQRATDDFGDHEGIIGTPKVLRWVCQFSDPDIDLGIKVLKNITYYSTSNIRKMTAELVEMVWDVFRGVPTSRVFFVPIGASYQGSSVVSRALRNVKGVSKDRIIDMTSLRNIDKRRIGALVFIDDFSGSGNTLTRDWWPMVESLVLPLGAPFALALLVLNCSAKINIQQLKANVLCVHELTDQHNVLGIRSHWFTPSEKSRLLDYCSRTGCGPELVRGYGDCGLLVAFMHGCPNNSLPILWNTSPTWEGLFKRHGL